MFAMLHGAWPLARDEAEADERGRVEAAVRRSSTPGWTL